VQLLVVPGALPHVKSLGIASWVKTPALLLLLLLLQMAGS